MQKPTHIKIIKRRDEEYFRLSYRCGDSRIVTQGFNTKRQLAKIISNDCFFNLALDSQKQEDMKE